MKSLLSLLLVAVLLVSAPAFADDWTAVKLRGSVLVNDIHGTGEWVRLSRGDVVSDDRVIRTMMSGNVEFQRGNETVSFGPSSQAQIVDKKSGKPFTTIVQQAGEVTVEADVQQVQHFAVQTPYLVAVVKGTKFAVTTGATGSTVVVARGLVEVSGAKDHKQVMVAAGQQVAATIAGALAVSGTPNAALTHPVVNGVVEDAVTDVTTVKTKDTALGGAVNSIGGTVGDVVTGAGTTVGNVVTGVGNTVGNVTNGVGTTVSSVATTVGSTVSTVATSGGSTVSTVTQTVGNTVSNVTSGVGSALHHLGL